MARGVVSQTKNGVSGAGLGTPELFCDTLPCVEIAATYDWFGFYPPTTG